MVPRNHLCVSVCIMYLWFSSVKLLLTFKNKTRTAKALSLCPSGAGVGVVNLLVYYGIRCDCVYRKCVPAYALMLSTVSKCYNPAPPLQTCVNFYCCLLSNVLVIVGPSLVSCYIGTPRKGRTVCKGYVVWACEIAVWSWFCRTCHLLSAMDG